MNEITKKTKFELYKTLIKEKNLIFDPTGEKWILFLNSIWDLRTMPSEDQRYTNAYDDVVQHTVNNDDWKLDELFLERLKLLEDNNTYIKFLESIVHPNFRENEDDIVKFVLLINSYIEDENLILTMVSYDENSLPIYNIIKKENSLPYSDLLKNTIPFYVIKEPSGPSNQVRSHSRPEKAPCFILVFNNRWNDYGYSTDFSLFYYSDNTIADDQVENFGSIKITHSTTDVIDAIPNNFLELDEKFCSLGQTYEFYETLKASTGKYFESVLYALKDAAFFSDIYEKFEKNEIFNTSLIRYDEPEQLLRSVKYKLYGFDLSNLYSFKYTFRPKYSNESEDIDFNFNNNHEFPNRIFAIIGKNGTGKTQLITSLPIEIAKKESTKFIPRTPMFSKVIAVSYSVFDNFEIPKSTASFNYVYCGLLNEKHELLTERQQLLRFHNTWQKIEELERLEKWRRILGNFIEADILDKFIIEERTNLDDVIIKVDRFEFNKIKNHLSSGQNVLLYIISEIIANIRRDSLLLFDEPETHLHPNAISQLMNVIYEVVHEFESYCIITTHSPLIVQELLSKNVRIIERHEDTVTVRQINIESFGQNLTTLTEEVFGNKEVGKQYKKIVDRMASEGKTYKDIISILETEDFPLSINVRLYIESKTV